MRCLLRQTEDKTKWAKDQPGSQTGDQAIDPLTVPVNNIRQSSAEGLRRDFSSLMMSRFALGVALPLGMLGRAKTMMRGWVAPSPPPATPYNVACANGHRLRGNRTEGYQALRCPTCGEAVFILPQSPLPQPSVPIALASANRDRLEQQSIVDAYPSDDSPHALVDPPEWSDSSASRPATVGVEASDDVADIDWVEEVEEPDQPVARPTSSSQDGPNQSTPPRRQPARPTRPRLDIPTQVTDEPLPSLSWKEWVSTHRNPLLAVGLVLVVLSAISLKRYRQHREELPRIAEIGRTEGFKKLDAGDFFAAKKILVEAASAVDAMGGRFEGADKIRQAALEAAIFTDLVPRTLEDLVEEAATSRDVAGWSSHFSSMYAGRSIILETTITAVPESALPNSHYADAYRILVGRGPKPEAIGRIDYAGFELFELTQPKLGEIKLLGARLQSLEFDLANNLWVVKLEPASGVFLTHPRALEAIHWPSGDPVEAENP